MFSKLAPYLWYTLVLFSCHCLPNIKNSSECVSTEHSLQNNLFSSLFPFALFSLIQSQVKIFRWRQESGMGLVFRREDLPLQCDQNPASQLCCPPVRTSSLLVHRVDLWMPPGEVGTARGDVRAPCCSIHRALCVDMSLTLH